MDLLKSLFKPSRVMLAMALAPFGDPVFAQEPGPVGYNPAKLPRELHFAVTDLRGVREPIPELPYLVELGRDVAELRCENGRALSFLAAPDSSERMYYCVGRWVALRLGGEVIRFDRAPSPSPHLRLQTGGMGVTVACDLGVPRRLYEPNRTSYKFRCADS